MINSNLKLKRENGKFYYSDDDDWKEAISTKIVNENAYLITVPDGNVALSGRQLHLSKDGIFTNEHYRVIDGYD